MICILLWYLAVKPAPRNEFVLLITNCSGERHEGWGGRDFCASVETMHRAAPLFNHHYQSRQAGSKRRLFRAQGTETDSVCGSHFTPWPVLRWRWLFSDSQPVRILCACKILLLVCYTNTPCSRCLWETGVINSEMITDIYILHERTASYLHFWVTRAKLNFAQRCFLETEAYLCRVVVVIFFIWLPAFKKVPNMLSQQQQQQVIDCQPWI